MKLLCYQCVALERYPFVYVRRLWYRSWDHTGRQWQAWECPQCGGLITHKGNAANSAESVEAA